MKRRILSMITALSLCLSLCPTWAFAAAGEPGLCAHHPSHTEDCGYIASTEGQPCGHEHTDECCTEETLCVHIHDESCYSDGELPAEGEAADTCAHVCTAESGCVTRTLNCQHAHDGACGYVQAGPGAPCGYECRICPIEDLIAALPDKVTEDNAEEVREQLDKILDLYRELTGEEQEQIDISRCLALQEALDAANAPAPIDEPQEGSVAQVELNGTTSYVTDLADAFAVENDGAKVTLLTSVELANYIQINSGTFTLDLNGCDINCANDSVISVNGDSTLTIKDSGTNGQIISTAGYAVVVRGTLTLEGGTFISENARFCGVYVDSAGAVLSVTGDKVFIQTTGGDCGFCVNHAQSVTLTAGTYGGIEIYNSMTLADLLGTDKHYAYYAGGKPIALTEGQKELTGTVTVKECGHEGSLQPNANGYQHGGACPYCGADIPLANHTAPNGEGKCDDCGAEIVAKVELNGTRYYDHDNLASSFAAENSGATVTLLTNVTVNVPLKTSGGSNITFEGGGFTLESESSKGIDTPVVVEGGKLTVKSGTIKSSAEHGMAVCVYSGEFVMTGGTLEGDCGLGIAPSTETTEITVCLSGGTLIGKINAIEYTGDSNDSKHQQFLLNYGKETAPHYAFFEGGNPIASNLQAGTYTIGECKHTGVEPTDNRDGTHTLTCPYCGYSDSHTTKFVATADEITNTVTLTGKCDETDCGYEHTIGSVVFTFPEKMVYGQPKVLKCEAPSSGEWDDSEWDVKAAIDKNDPNSFWGFIGKDLDEVYRLGDKIPAGNHTLYLACYTYFNGKQLLSNVCGLPFTVKKAPLTPSIAAPDGTTKPYDGTTDVPAALGLTIQLAGVLGGDDVTATAAFAYNDENVSKATTIKATGITLSGADAGNYELTSNEAEIPGKIEKATNTEAPKTGEGYTLNYPDETIQIDEGYEVSTRDDGSGTEVKNDGSITGCLGQTLYIRKAETENHAASKWTVFTLAARPDAPTGLTKRDETLKGQNDGKIIGVTAAMEYSTDGGTTWKPCPDGALEGLSGGAEVRVRLKADENTPSGKFVTRSIGEGTPITVTFDSDGGSTVQSQTGLSYGEKVEKPADPKKENFEFQGWFKADGTAWDFDTALTDAAVSLTAKWKQVKFSVGGTVVLNDGTTPASGADVKLMQGSAVKQSTTAGADGSFTFDTAISPGAYNIVTTYNGQTKTTLITIENSDMLNVSVKLPPVGVSSKLEVRPGTPAVVVGGLDDEAEGLKTGGVSTVTVSMTVEGKQESAVEPDEVAAIKEAAKTSDVNDPVVEYLDVSITKNVDGTQSPVTSTAEVMEIVIPFDFSGKDASKLVVLRYHGSIAAALAKLGSKPASNYADGQFYLDTASGFLYIYATQFSTYAVAYEATRYTVIFNANGGTVSPASGTTDPNGTLSSLPTPTRSDGYTFLGWYTSENGGTQVTKDTVFQADTTIYAQWRQNSSTPTQPTTPVNPGGGGGWSGTPTYSVTIGTPEHGKVTSSPVNAASGSTVTLTVTPDSGYVLDTLTVTDSRGNTVKLTAQGGGKYTFTMPSRAVTVKAAFAPLPNDTEKPCDGGADCPSRGFTDLGGVGTWYHEAVDYVLRNGLMNGYSNGTFGPNDNLSRAQLAQILFNKEGRPVVNYLMRYNDVANGAWYTEAIRWATSQGIVGGYGNGMFGPNDNITREQLAAMLWRYAGSPAATNKELRFNDADEISGFALEAMRWAVENGIINGFGNGQLGPKGLATRAQVAQMLQNFLKDK